MRDKTLTKTVIIPAQYVIQIEHHLLHKKLTEALDKETKDGQYEVVGIENNKIILKFVA